MTILDATADSPYVVVNGFPYGKESLSAFKESDGRFVFTTRKSFTEVIGGPSLPTEISVDGGVTTFADEATAVAWLKANFFKSSLGVKSPKSITGNYTLTIDDNRRSIYVNGGPSVITCPGNLPLGFVVTVWSFTSASVSFIAEAGSSIYNRNALYSLSGFFAGASVECYVSVPGANKYVIQGDLA